MVHRVMQEMIRYFAGDVRRINHALKVYAFAQLIGRLEGIDEDSQLALECAGLLHDIGIPEAERKHGSSAGPYQELEGPPIAKAILQTCAAPDALIERVCFLTGHHHSYSKIDGTDFQILVEADFLVNAYEDDMEQRAIQSAVAKLFRTQAGIRLARTMYRLGDGNL